MTFITVVLTPNLTINEGVSVGLFFDYLNNRSSDRLHTVKCIAEDPWNCSVECEVVWMSGSRESCT